MPNKTRRKRGSTKRTLTKRSRRLMRHMRRIKTRRGGNGLSKIIHKYINDYIKTHHIQVDEGGGNDTNLKTFLASPTLDTLMAIITYYTADRTQKEKRYMEEHQKSLNAGSSGLDPFYYQHEWVLNLLYEIQTQFYSSAARQQHHMSDHMSDHTRNMDPWGTSH